MADAAPDPRLALYARVEALWERGLITGEIP
jgi:hypothetical protein